MIAAIILLATTMSAADTTLTNELAAKYGEAQRPAIERGIAQVRQFWRAEDGDDAALAEFVRANYAGDATTRDALFDRMEFAFESLDGHMLEISRDWRRQSDLDLGTVYGFDEIMAAYDPSAHVGDDLFANKLAFVVLLNFPLTTLEQRLAEGDKWSRRQWAEARLALRFSKRVPSNVNLAIARATAEAGQYVATYNIWMYHVLDGEGRRLFPPKMRLLEHWNLRDQIKADYSDPKDGLARQRLIQRVIERIVDQSIPAAVIDNPAFDWNVVANSVKPAAENDDGSTPAPIGRAPSLHIAEPEPNTRYATLLKTFRAAKQLDPYSPTAPTPMHPSARASSSSETRPSSSASIPPSGDSLLFRRSKCPALLVC